jgi:hypothetical protein
MGADVGLVRAIALEGLDQGDQPRWRAESGNLGTYEGGNMLIANMFGDRHRRIDVGFVPAGAGHLLGSSRAIHDSDEERPVDKHNGGKGQ